MILIIGDSNYRNTLDTYGEELSLAVGEKIIFELNTSNESLRTQLAGTDSYKIILVASPINEIAHKVKSGGKKGRDETIKVVVEEQNKIVNESATREGRLGTLHLLLPPLLRQDPVWMEERLKWVTFNLRDKISENSPWNVGIGNPIAILAEDLGPDKVHLNEAGMKKLFQGLKSDLKKCKENLGEGSLSQDWASQVMDEPANQPPTPGTMRKRAREVEETSDEDEEETVVKKVKKRKAEDKMDKLLSLVKEMKEENKMARSDTLVLREKVVTTDKKVDDLKADFDGFKNEVVRDNELTAEMREDIDGLENENLKIIVIVRKLKAEKQVPKDGKLLRTYIQDLSRTLVTKVMGTSDSANGVKYAAMLYSFVDPTKKDNRVGLVPPFKICFNSKDLAVAFRDKAVKMAKVGAPKRTFGANLEEAMDEDQEQGASTSQANQGVSNVCQGAYFSFYQTAGTRFRVTLMWAVADALKTKTKQVWVSQTSRPTLQIKEGGKVVKTLTFVQTMSEYKEKIGQKTLEDVKKSALKLFAGRLEKTFVVIKD